MASQLILDLPVRPALGREDFFVSAANAVAVDALDAWRDWPGGKLALIGPAGAGKTHLASVWASETGARIVQAADLPGMEIEPLAGVGHVAVEDVHRIGGNAEAEAALFHLHNLLLAEGGRLLLTGREAPSRWGLTLPDLASRMEGTPVTKIDAPDDALLGVVMVKLFADRQIAVDASVISYLAGRMERSFDFAHRLVEALDRASLSEKRAVTRPLAARVLDKLAETGA